MVKCQVVMDALERIAPHHLAEDWDNPGLLVGIGGGGERQHDVADMVLLLFAALVTGFGVKAALVPLHGWLPLAMVAPAPVSALLHAVAVVKAGAFAIVRVVYEVFGVEFAAAQGLDLPADPGARDLLPLPPEVAEPILSLDLSAAGIGTSQAASRTACAVRADSGWLLARRRRGAKACTAP